MLKADAADMLRVDSHSWALLLQLAEQVGRYGCVFFVVGAKEVSGSALLRPIRPMLRIVAALSIAQCTCHGQSAKVRTRAMCLLESVGTIQVPERSFNVFVYCPS